MTANDPLELLGTTLVRKYAIDSVVRIEASTIVYRATDVHSGRSIGVRVLAGVASLSEAKRRVLLERLGSDQATLADLAQIIPAAYPLRDVGTVRTPRGVLPFVVLDWPHGITLRQMVQPEGSRSGRASDPPAGGWLPESIDQVISMLEPVAVAVAIAHENGVIHGGITSDRVLFREEGESELRRATLLDFGVARVLSAIDGGSEPEAADDVRAIASIVAQVMARACGADARLDDARTPRARGVVIADEVEAVFVRALGPGTYGSVGHLWSALRRAMGLATLRSLEATIPPESRPLASTSLRPTARSTPPVHPSRVSREPIVYVVSAFALLVLGGTTAIRARSATRDPGPSACERGMVPRGGASVRLGQAGDADDPLHAVTLRPFCIDQGAVTTSAYAACVGRGDCPPPSRTNEWDGISADDHEVLDVFCTARDPSAQGSRAVNCVSWDMAQTYCAKQGKRLPTEAEWELASSTTAASVAEWVSDWRAPIERTSTADPSGPASGQERVVRGAHAVGAAPTRFGATPSTRSHAIGFRCAKTP
jgi:hypothetical protein